MNALTDKKVLEKDELFATLGTTVGKLKLPKDSYTDAEGRFIVRSDILIYDTIGFIRDLPPELIDAFSSTLEESLSCEMLLEVVDASDSHWRERIEVTDAILQRIGAKQRKWYIFNQIDKISLKELKNLKKDSKMYTPLFTSAKT